MTHRWIASCARRRCQAWARGTRRGFMHGEPAVGRVIAVPVYWSRVVRAERLDITRWTCGGCMSETQERPSRREGVNR